MKTLFNYIEKGELKNNAHYTCEEQDNGVICIIKKNDESFRLDVLKMSNIYFIETNDEELRNVIFKKICTDYLDMLKNGIKFVVDGYQIFSDNLKKFKRQINYEQI